MSKEKTTTNTSKFNTRAIAGCGMLAAAATALQYLEIPSPVSFIALDLSDLPALLGAFAYGPVAGVIIEFVKKPYSFGGKPQRLYRRAFKLYFRCGVYPYRRLNLQAQKNKKGRCFRGHCRSAYYGGSQLSLKPFCGLPILLHIYAKRSGA